MLDAFADTSVVDNRPLTTERPRQLVKGMGMGKCLRLGRLHEAEANAGDLEPRRVTAFLNGVGLSTPRSKRSSVGVGCFWAASSEGGVNTQRPQRSEDGRC